MKRPRVFVAFPQGPVRDSFFTPEIVGRLLAVADVHWQEGHTKLKPDGFAFALRGCDACLTGWDSPVITEELLRAVPTLRFIGHVGGTVRPFMAKEIVGMLVVTNGAQAMAASVAEGTLGLILASLRDTPSYDRTMKEGGWRAYVYHNEGLFDQHIGLIGLGGVGRELVRLLKPFNVRVSVYDPYVSERSLIELGVERSPLEQLLREAKIISLHAALTTETYHMLNADRLGLIQDGAILVNTARGSLLDERALENELRKGRFKAALDVFEEEPLSPSSLLRRLPNLILTPHMAGPTIDRRPKVTEAILDDLRLFFDGREPRHRVTAAKYDLMT